MSYMGLVAQRLIGKKLKTINKNELSDPLQTLVIGFDLSDTILNCPGQSGDCKRTYFNKFIMKMLTKMSLITIYGTASVLSNCSKQDILRYFV